jgi:transcriptional regulator GlxA family with amidase domain
MDIAILIFDRLTALDAVGPYEVLGRLPGAKISFISTETGPKRTDQGSLALIADRTLDELPEPDVILVPGGPGQAQAMLDEHVLCWLRHAHETTQWTTSVCTGSLVLGAAGLLTGRRATTHWMAMDQLAAFGAIPVQERFVHDGKIITAAGVSAGIDMAITLASLIAGDEVAQAIQVGIEYDPQPPFEGSPERAPRELVESLRRFSRFEQEQVAQRPAPVGPEGP